MGRLLEVGDEEEEDEEEEEEEEELLEAGRVKSLFIPFNMSYMFILSILFI